MFALQTHSRARGRWSADDEIKKQASSAWDLIESSPLRVRNSERNEFGMGLKHWARYDHSDIYVAALCK